MKTKETTHAKGPKHCIRGIDKHSVNFQPAITIAWEDLSGRIPIWSSGTYLGSEVAAIPDLMAALRKLDEVATRTTANLIAFDGAEELDTAIDFARAAILRAEGK